MPAGTSLRRSSEGRPKGRRLTDHAQLVFVSRIPSNPFTLVSGNRHDLVKFEDAVVGAEVEPCGSLDTLPRPLEEGVALDQHDLRNLRRVAREANALLDVLHPVGPLKAASAIVALTRNAVLTDS